MKNLVLLTLFAFITLANLSCSGKLAAQNSSDYAGQENRKIKSLSETDIDQLKNGRGWGLAKAAELNGVPGPVHIIEMKDKIGLTEKQLAQVEKLYLEMKNKAVPLGVKLIDLERDLNDAFAEKRIDDESLAERLKEIANVSRDLRFVHLSAHLRTPGILTAAQVETYNRLRGYKTLDPCAEVPEGHDPKLWKEHNNCN